MFLARALRFTQRRSFISSLFGATFFGTIITVAASSILPCPVGADGQRRYADADAFPQGRAVIHKRPTRRWIEEKIPGQNA